MEDLGEFNFAHFGFMTGLLVDELSFFRQIPSLIEVYSSIMIFIVKWYHMFLENGLGCPSGLSIPESVSHSNDLLDELEQLILINNLIMIKIHSVVYRSELLQLEIALTAAKFL